MNERQLESNPLPGLRRMGDLPAQGPHSIAPNRDREDVQGWQHVSGETRVAPMTTPNKPHRCTLSLLNWDRHRWDPPHALHCISCGREFPEALETADPGSLIPSDVLEEALRILRKNENGSQYREEYCIECAGDMDGGGHEADCALMAVLRRIDAVLGRNERARPRSRRLFRAFA